ncbi:MAG TPA: MerC domain-containing protein, partial [Allocoleopsis sp.]
TFITVEKLHQLLLWCVLPISLLALLLGYFQRRDKVTILLGLIGLSQLIIAAMLGNEFLSESSEAVITPLAGLILIAGHIRNYQRCRCNECQT